jgi:hypothetical protein
LTFLLVVAVALNLPLLLLTLILRGGIPRQVCAALVGGGFAAAVAYMIWRIEWFDVWRHGTPAVSYLLTAFVPYVGAFGVVGYSIGHAIAGKARESESVSRRTA